MDLPGALLLPHHMGMRPLQALRRDALAIADAGIAAADARRLVDRALATDALPAAGRVHVIAAGKASRGMAGAAAGRPAGRIRSGLVVGPSAEACPPFHALPGGHPLPTADSERAGRRALSLAASIPPDDTLLVLLSGGASALLAVPAEGISLDDKRETTRRLLMAGADIQALNTVRRHISAIKGGWLAAAAACRCRTLAISDVVGDAVSAIGSGPTVGDITTFEDALDILRAHDGIETYPEAVVARLRAGTRGDVPDTPTPEDPRLARAEIAVIGSRFDAMDGAAREAEARGYRVIRRKAPVVGSARSMAPPCVEEALVLAGDLGGPACIVSTGETTVRVTGRGKGGRNQEFALAAAERLASADRSAVLASVGTDGVDGPTDAAGALADHTTVARARAAGLDVRRYLDDNDAYAFFEKLEDLITTGPTQTNVGDLQVFVVA